MLCVQSPWFSVNINGNLEGFFKRTIGLRQGDPLSPNLFVLVIKYFSRGLSRLFLERKIAYHPKCVKISLSHLLFADDVMIFMKPKLQGVEV